MKKGVREDWQRKLGAEFAGLGTMRAKLYDLGAYPGAKAAGAEPGQRVSGELYRLRDPEFALTILDKYEGFFSREPIKSLFVRELVLVTLEDGRKIRAWAYLYNCGIANAKLIASGCYGESINAARSSHVIGGRAR